MASVISYKGEGEGPWLQSGGELTTDRKGLVTGRLVYKVKVNGWGMMPVLNSPHPYAAWATMERRSVRFAPGFWLVSCDYAGSEEEVSEPVYDFNPGTGNEPIETHDKFVAELGGTPSDPKNGAVFLDSQGNVTEDDDVGMFDRFKLEIEGGPNPMGGVREFLTANNSTWTKSWTQRSKPSGANKPVKIGSPSGPAPSFGGHFNWLELPVAYSKRGSAYDCRQTWLLSGPWGWNTMIYG
jgi:hypothetical protein